MKNVVSAITNRLVILVPYVWLLFFFLIPFFIVFKISLSTTAIAMPPYTPVLGLGDGISGLMDQFREFSFDNYVWLTEDPLYYTAYISSVIIAGVSTLLALLVGYPIAYGMARAPESIRPTLLMLVILPFWTSFLIRVYAWIGILKPEGLLNQFLQSIGVIDEPLIILARREGVGLHDASLEACRQARFNPKLAHTPSLVSTVLSYVEAGAGIGVIPDSVSSLGAGQPIVFRPLKPTHTVELVMVWSDEVESPPAAAFRSLMLEWLKAGTLWKQ